MKNFKKSDVADIYPLTPMQEGMLFHFRMNRHDTAYFQQAELDARGYIDIDIYEETLNTITAKYDILRTVFLFEKVKRPVQVVLKERKIRVYSRDLTGMDKTSQENVIREFRQNDMARNFDLQKDILLRVAVFRTNSDRWRLIWSTHHILMDGWCLGTIFKDFSRIYRARLAGEPVEPGNAVPYSNYIHWLSSQDRQAGLTFWSRYLEGIETRSSIPSDTEPGSGGENEKSAGEFEASRFVMEFNRMESEKLGHTASYCGVTVNILFRAAWGLVLQRFSYCDDVVFGAVVSGRPPDLENVDQIVGLFINTVPVRVTTGEAGEHFNRLLERLYRDSADGKPFEYFRLAEIQGLTPLNRYLIDHILVFENFPLTVDHDPDNPTGFHIEDGIFFERTTYDLNIVVEPGDRYCIRFAYNNRIYTPELIVRLASYLKKTLETAAADPGFHTRRFDMLTQKEKIFLLQHLNRDRYAAYPADKTIGMLFRDMVEKHPDAVAVTGKSSKPIRFPGTIRITYRELYQRAAAAAWELRQNGVVPNSIVVIVEDRSVDMIIAIIAILQAGAAYLPVSTGYPPERIAYILRDSEARYILDKKRNPPAPRYPGWNGLQNRMRIIVYDVLFPNTKPWYQKGKSVSRPPLNGPRDLLQPPPVDSSPSDPAYIIYTSGTSGNPKGVIIEHRNVVRLLQNDRTRFDFGIGDTWSAFHSFCFDFSVWELFGPLLTGGRTTIIGKNEARESRLFIRTLIKEKVTILNLTPSAFYALRNFLDTGENTRKTQWASNRLRLLIFGGEALNPIPVKSWLKKNRGVRAVNMYGITETTVHVTYKEIAADLPESGTSPIGVPIPTLSVYVVDRHMNLVPPGAIGEIVVGGAGVARGYLNRPELTAERFADNPFHNTSPCGEQEKLYRSGDLGRLNPGGELEYVGRLDEQLKIRGHRIELKEIEIRLSGHPRIKSALVLPGGTGFRDYPARFSTDYLCAYYIPYIPYIPDIEEPGVPLPDMGQILSDYLARWLPEYMIPSFFIPMESFPLTTNGKIDKKALPLPRIDTAGDTVGNGDADTPRTALEQKLEEIWLSLLEAEYNGIREKKPAIGLDTNFFTIGGHSLNAAQMIVDVQHIFKTDVPLADFFQAPTIRALSGYLESRTVAAKESFPAPQFLNRVLLKKAEDDGQAACNIFMFHDVTGNTDSYMDLCRCLPDNAGTCWGLRPAEIKPGPFNTSIQKLAAGYAATVNATPGSGSAYPDIILLGWSLGGLFAFETARQLRNSGADNLLLILLDAPPPLSVEHDPEGFSLDSELDWLLRFLPGLTPEIEKKLKQSPDLDNLWDTVNSHLETGNFTPQDLESFLSQELSVLIPAPSRSTVRRFTGNVNLARSLLLARDRYAPAQCPERTFASAISTVLFVPTRTKISYHHRWRDFLGYPPEIHTIDGDHFSMLKSPGVETIGKIIEKAVKTTNNNKE